MSLDAFKGVYLEAVAKARAKQVEGIAKTKVNVDRYIELHAITATEAEYWGIGTDFKAVFPNGGGFYAKGKARGRSFDKLLTTDDVLKGYVNELRKIAKSIPSLELKEYHLTEIDKWPDDIEGFISRTQRGMVDYLNKYDSKDPSERQAQWDYYMDAPTVYDATPMNEPAGPSGMLESPELIAAIRERPYPFPDELAEPEPSVDPINPDEISEETEPSSDSINPDEIETLESEPENEVDTSDPEIEAELVPSVDPEVESGTVIPASISEQEDNFTEVTAPSPINAPATDASFDTNVDGNISMDEYNANSGDVISMISENVANEISSINTQNDAAQVKLDKTEGDYDASIGRTDSGEIQTESPITSDSVTLADITNNTETGGNVFNETTNSEITEGGETNINSVNPSVEQSSTSSLDDDDESFSFDDVAALRERFGIAESSEDEALSEDSINDSVSPDEVLNDNSITEGDSTEVNSINNSIEAAKGSASEAISGGIEVAKSKLGIDKNIAPINTPKKEEAKEDLPTDSVTASEVLNDEIAAVPTATNSESTDNSMSSESTSNSSRSSSMQSDMSGVESRLRKIENLLSGPLEVKIID